MITSKSAKIRTDLGSPVIDSDGHCIEFEPALMDEIVELAGTNMLKRYLEVPEHIRWFAGGAVVAEEYAEKKYKVATTIGGPRGLRVEELNGRVPKAPWWGVHTKNTLDRATAMLPRLFCERMPEAGLDFAIVYPSLGLGFTRIQDDEVRRIACRALNNYHIRLWEPYSKWVAPVGVIPANTPEEAVDELNYAVGTLGFRAILMPGHIRRPVECQGKNGSQKCKVMWIDNMALDSEYEYDVVWQKCLELQVAPTFHTGSMGLGTRTSTSNYSYNHIGHFGASNEGICKGLFMGGVTMRFPELRFAFLEGGVGWAVSLINDLYEHWKKRSADRISELDPEALDIKKLKELVETYGEKEIGLRRDTPTHLLQKYAERAVGETPHDDWQALGNSISKERFLKGFVDSFYFGCEADDRMNAAAFNRRMNPSKAPLRALFSSDIGHWDVPDIRGVLAEAYELVEDQLIDEDDFKCFVSDYPLEFWTHLNPDFFANTSLESVHSTQLR